MPENMMTKKPKANDILSIVQSDAMKSQWALVLPKCLTPDRMARVALSQLRKNPKLGQCTQDSLLSSLMTCAEFGIEPNGRDAHLIPYGKECTLIIDYKGLVKLVRRDSSVKDVQVFTVRENDDFKWTQDGIKHSFGMIDRGEVVGVYTKISWMNGTESFGEPMTKPEADAIRKGSRAGNSGPWVSYFNEMWKKSAIRRDSKMWPLGGDTLDAMEVDADKPTTMFADATSSSPVYAEPAIPEEVKKPEAKKEDPAPAAEEEKPKDGAPETTAAKPADLKDVADMNKTELNFEITKHKDAKYFPAVLDSCKLGDELDWTTYPMSCKRDFVTALRETERDKA